MDSAEEKRSWSMVRRAQSFTHAFRGLRLFFLTTPNAWIQIFIAVIVLLSGFYFKVSSSEWIALLFSIGFVLVSEALNTAIEIDIDLTSPEYHPYARDTKDVAAAAVLLSVLLSVIVGAIIFLPKIF